MKRLHPVLTLLLVAVSLTLGWFAAMLAHYNDVRSRFSFISKSHLLTKSSYHLVGTQAGRVQTELNGHNPNLVKSEINISTTFAPIPKYAQVYTRRTQTWERSEVCRNLTGSYRRATLRLRIGHMPIFIYDPKIDVHVSGSISRTGSWEIDRINIIIKFLMNNKEAQFLDVGANLGVYSLAAAKLGRKVIAVDPLKMNIERLCKSFEEGKLIQNTTLVFNALSDEIQNVTLAKDKNNVGGTFVFQNKNNNKVKGSTLAGRYNDVIMTANLDHLLELPGFNAKDMIAKIDVEGYESKVLKSGRQFFENVNIIIILMEWNFHKTGTSGTEIVEFLSKRGYKPFNPSLVPFELNVNNIKNWPNDVIWKKIPHLVPKKNNTTPVS